MKNKEIFLNHHTNYIANNVYLSYEAARIGCGYSDQVETVKYIAAPEEPKEDNV
jgi:hypothetical protein